LLLLSLIFLGSSFSYLDAQSQNPETTNYRYWIYFKDKGKYKKDDPMPAGSEAYNIAKSELSDKALWRRGKVLPASTLVSYDDLPVNQEYIDKIKKMGLLPHAISKWFNALSIMAKKKDLDEIKKLAFVEKIEGVQYLDYVMYPSGKKNEVNKQGDSHGNKYNYGPSYWQNEQIKVPALHNYGVTGFGVTVGMCDDGFNWRNHEALKNRRVLGEYDWIFKDDSTQNQISPNQIPTDPFDQDGHGTATMSTLGGFAEGKLIGPAFDAEFWLSKTEFGPTETPVEEDYWLQAVEWMESKGIEVLSCSLIYKPFDKPNNQYDYKDMNGRTTVIVRAAEHLIYLGVVECNSMGNEYQLQPPSIVSPADGDSVISVGAIDSAGTIAFFSSNGPTSDGRMKPDVVAMGVDNYVASSFAGTRNDTTFTYESGTSFSCPLTAGVCSLILSVHPELTPMQVKESLKMTADKKDKPDNIYGWGVINAYNAALYFGMFTSNKPEMKISSGNVRFSLYVISKNQIDPASVKFYYAADGSTDFQEVTMELIEKTSDNNSGQYFALLPADVKYDVLKFYFTASDSEKNITSPYNAPQKFFFTNNETKKVEIF
jgi:serine protease AprX